MKAGVDLEFDLTNPAIMETIRDVLMNDENEVIEHTDEDEAQFSLNMI